MGPYANVISKPNCVNKSWDSYFYECSWCNSGFTIGPYTNAIFKPICPNCTDKS